MRGGGRGGEGAGGSCFESRVILYFETSHVGPGPERVVSQNPQKTRVKLEGGYITHIHTYTQHYTSSTRSFSCFSRLRARPVRGPLWAGWTARDVLRCQQSFGKPTSEGADVNKRSGRAQSLLSSSFPHLTHSFRSHSTLSPLHPTPPTYQSCLDEERAERDSARAEPSVTVSPARLPAQCTQ